MAFLSWIYRVENKFVTLTLWYRCGRFSNHIYSQQLVSGMECQQFVGYFQQYKISVVPRYQWRPCEFNISPAHQMFITISSTEIDTVYIKKKYFISWNLGNHKSVSSPYSGKFLSRQNQDEIPQERFFFLQRKRKCIDSSRNTNTYQCLLQFHLFQLLEYSQ